VTRYLPIASIVAAMTVSVTVLTVSGGDTRLWAFRATVVVVGVLAARAVLQWLATFPLAPEPFRRPSRSWRPPWRRKRGIRATAPAVRVLHLATFSAGDAHRGLRPLLQDVADERLRARHGIALTDPRAEALLRPPTWELVRPDRPVPHDLRAPGLSTEQIDTVLADLEAL